jgi:glycosyltransferase involved in cell wall biosynthesis
MSAPNDSGGIAQTQGSSPAPLLMITELFLPTKGGTAVMFEDDCRRIGGKEVHIVTAAVPGDEAFDHDHPNTIHRLVLRRSPWLRPESLVMYTRLLLRSMRLAARNRFAAVLAGRALPEGLVAWIVGRLYHCKVVIYAHGEELTGWGRGRKFQAMCFALRHADTVLANSDFTRDTLVSLIGVRHDRIVMAYPTVDAQRFRPGLPFEDLHNAIGLAPGRRLILSVGRLQRRKGFDQVLRALPGLVARGLDVHYAIVGIGEDRDYLLGIARDLGVSPRLHLLGHVDPDDLPRWYNAADLFAMPNRDIGGDTEGFGIVYLEANACARPALAGQAGGTGSAVEHGVNGLRVPGEDPQAVEAGIARLLLDEQEARRLGTVARERILFGFTPQRRVELLRGVIAGRRPAARTLRVLMYTAYFAPEYSGAALQALTLARELRRRGHLVEFVTNRWPGLDESAVVDGFPVTRVEPGRLRKHREFRLWLNLARHVWKRRHDIDIIHSHGAYFTHSFVGPLAGMLGMKSLVKASLANDDLADLSRPVIGGLHRWMLRRVAACIGTSDDLVTEFRAGGMDSDHIHNLPNGVDSDRFQPVSPTVAAALRAEMNLPAGRPIALYVGVLDQRKNILWLAEQWIANDAFGTGALLLAVGPQGRDDAQGLLRARLQDLAAQHPNLFRLHDFQANVARYYQCTDVLILPSYREGLPNVILEAMASGLSCVAARASGSRELITDGVNGFTYAPDDAEGLAAAVRHCLSSRSGEMGAQSRRIALERFSIQAVARRYEEIYASILAPNTRTSKA